MTPDAALCELRAQADPDRAAQMAAYHKVPRPYLGLPNPQVDALCKGWRARMDLDQRLALCAALWETDIFEARLAAAKLLTQARIRPRDDGAWELLCAWVADFDSWALADHVCIAAQKRLIADPARLQTVEHWISSDHMWTRRAAFVATLPWTKQNNPKPADLDIRDRILGWAATLADDPDWFIQKAIAWWLRDLSRHDPARTIAFLDSHGDRLKPFARKEAARHLAR